MKNFVISHSFIAIVFLLCLNSCKKENKANPKPSIDSLGIGLIAYFPLTDGAPINDYSGNGLNTIGFNVTAGPDRFGNGYADLFSPNSDASINDVSFLRLTNTDFTINIWVDLTSYNANFNGCIVCKGGISSGWTLRVFGDYDNLIGNFIFASSAYNHSAIDIVPVRNEWHMITYTYNLSSAQISMYVDAVLQQTIHADPVLDSPGVPVTIGTGGLRGFLNDLRIYKRKLSANDIQKLYHLSN